MVIRSIDSVLRQQLRHDRQELEAARSSRWHGFADCARHALGAIIMAGCDPAEASTLLAHLRTKPEAEWSTADVDHVLDVIVAVLEPAAAY